MIRVIDASVAVRWFVELPGSPQAIRLLEQPGSLIAPDLVVAEVANTAWKLVRAGEITVEHGERISTSVTMAFEDLVPTKRLAARAFEIAMSLPHSVYDCLYLALGEQQTGQVMTADEKLVRKVAGSPWERLVTLLA